MMLKGKRLSKDMEAALRPCGRSDGECRSEDDANEALPTILLASWALTWVRDELVDLRRRACATLSLEARPRESAGADLSLGAVSP
jgi:hypothetical protein